MKSNDKLSWTQFPLWLVLVLVFMSQSFGVPELPGLQDGGSQGLIALSNRLDSSLLA
jgi:hypothetical protein